MALDLYTQESVSTKGPYNHTTILRHCHYVDVVNPNVEETCGTKGDDRRPYIIVGDDLYPEDVGNGPPMGQMMRSARGDTQPINAKSCVPQVCPV